MEDQKLTEIKKRLCELINSCNSFQELAIMLSSFSFSIVIINGMLAGFSANDTLDKSIKK